MTDDAPPMISIIVIVRDPRDASDHVLGALAAQAEIERAEVILVDGRPDQPPLAGFDIPKLSRIAAPSENMPRLKAIGAKAARGDVLAFLEPKAAPAPGWVSAILAAYKDNPIQAVGGPVLFAGARTAVDQAAFIFEYGPFSPDELRSGRIRDLPGNNMALPRESLFALCTEILDREGLNKPFCQQRLVDGEVPVVMNPDMRVTMTTKHRLWPLLRSRFSYARCFGGARIALSPPPRGLLYRLGAPAIALILLARHLSAVRRAEAGSLLPGARLALAALCLAWAAGEAAGYWFGKGSSCRYLY